MRNKCTYLHTRVVLNRTNTRTHWWDQPQGLSRALAPRAALAVVVYRCGGACRQAMSHPLSLALRRAGARALLSHPRPAAAGSGAPQTTPPPTSFVDDAYVLVLAAESGTDRTRLIAVTLTLIVLAVAVVYCICAQDGQPRRAAPRVYVVADACATPRRPTYQIARPTLPPLATCPPGAGRGHGSFVEVEYGLPEDLV